MAGRLLHIVITVLVLGVLAPDPAVGQGRFPPDSFTNLRVLPRDIEARELVPLMASFTRALGIRCSHCHMGEEGEPLETYDFASDDKQLKRKAREMLRMVQAINGQHLDGLESPVEPALRVECFTCHRGVREPRTLQAVLLAAYDAAGIDSLMAAYRGVRDRYHGRAVYDFGEVPLADVGSALAGRGRDEDAERAFRLNVEMNPTSSFAKLMHATSALSVAFRSDLQQGRAVLADLDARYGAVITEQLLNAVGTSLLRQRQLPSAIEVLRITAERHPDSWLAHDALGGAYAANGDVAEAIRHYERSLALNPENANARERLRELRGRVPNGGDGTTR